MRSLYLIPVILILFSCGKKQVSFPEKTDTTKAPVSDTLSSSINSNEKLDAQVIDSIYALPEVKERGEYIEKQTKGKNKMVVLITERPDDNKEDFYMVEVGEDNTSSVVNHFTFYVYYPSFKIKYLDPVEGKEISLEVWRKSNK